MSSYGDYESDREESYSNDPTTESESYEESSEGDCAVTGNVHDWNSALSLEDNGLSMRPARWDLQPFRSAAALHQSHQTTFFALTNESTKFVADAVGIDTSDPLRVTVKVAIFSPSELIQLQDMEYILTDPAFRAQEEFFGMYRKSTCRFGNSCRRRDTCTFVHDDYDDQYGGGNCRPFSTQLKSTLGGFNERHPTPAVVLTISFPVSPETQAVEWMNPLGSTFAIEGVTLAERVVDVDARINEGDSKSKKLQLIVECAGALGGSCRFPHLFKEGAVMMGCDTPSFNAETQTLEIPDRAHCDAKRYVISVFLGLFDVEALHFIRRKRPAATLVSTQVKLDASAAVKAALVEGGLYTKPCYQLLDGLPITSSDFHSIVGSDVKWVCNSADALTQQQRAADDAVLNIKFTSPLRRFRCLHNLLQLISTIKESDRDVFQWSRTTNEHYMNTRCRKIHSCVNSSYRFVKAQKLVGIVPSTSNHNGACIPLVFPMSFLGERSPLKVIPVPATKDADGVTNTHFVQLLLLHD